MAIPINNHPAFAKPDETSAPTARLVAAIDVVLGDTKEARSRLGGEAVDMVPLRAVAAAAEMAQADAEALAIKLSDRGILRFKLVALDIVNDHKIENVPFVGRLA